MKKSTQFIFGIHPIAEAIGSGKEIGKVYIRKGLNNEHFTALFRQIRDNGIPYQYVPPEKLNRLVGGKHQGIVAELSLVEYKSLEEMVQRTFEAGEDPFILVLDRVTDVRNFGAIARTAECAGVHMIVVPGRETATPSADAIKTSAGALNRIAVSRQNDLGACLQFLKDSGIHIVATTEKATNTYSHTGMTGPIALVMGSEEKGISNSLLDMADSLVKIPMVGAIASLNVSVAAGIFLFEIRRQRQESVK